MATTTTTSPSKLWHSARPAPKAHLLLVALSVAQFLPIIPVNVQIVLQAAICVYCGSWRSIKPSPPKETMSKTDAMKFPVMGSALLVTLFLAFKFLPKWVVNVLIAVYLAGLGTIVLTNVLVPFLEPYLPPAIVSREITFPPFKIPQVIDATEDRLVLTVPEILVGVLSAGFTGWYIAKKHWFANNMLGIAFSLEAIEHLNLGSVQVGAILLSGLFFYDIFWVFCTPVMVSVAKNFEAPIKILFPRPITKAALEAAAAAAAAAAAEGAAAPAPPKQPFSMLGLGDIVIPGIFVALLLRYDVMHNFSTSYFNSVFAGYTFGLALTIVVMNVFNAAQPALLYIVPAVLGAVALHAWQRKELNKIWHFSEEAKEDQAVKKDEGSTSSEVNEQKKSK